MANLLPHSKCLPKVLCSGTLSSSELFRAISQGKGIEVIGFSLMR